MGTPTATLRSISGLALALAGSVAAALGSFFVFASVASAITEGWGGHASGLSLLVYGLLFVLAGALAVRRGVRIYRLASSSL